MNQNKFENEVDVTLRSDSSLVRRASALTLSSNGEKIS